MAYKVIILYQLYMPSYFLGTFTEYPSLILRGMKSFMKKMSILTQRNKTGCIYIIKHDSDENKT